MAKRRERKGQTRREVLQNAAMAGVAVSVSAHVGCAPAASAKRPNIILVFPDQHRHDAIAAAGDPVIKTPTMDRLISEGTLFEKMWCQSPVCRPARASLITGRYPHQHGVTGNNTTDFDPAWPTFMKNLQAVGYTTSTFGKTHYTQEFDAEEIADPNAKLDFDARKTHPFIQKFGFDYVVDEGGQWFPAMTGFVSGYTEFLKAHGMLETYQQQIRAHWHSGEDHYTGFINNFPAEFDVVSFLAKESIDWLENKRDKSKPFFLTYAPVKPHPPYSADPVWAAYYKDKAMPQGPRDIVKAPNPIWEAYLGKNYAKAKRKSPEAIDHSKRMYYAMISLVDQKVGEIMQALEKQGELDNTWIFWSSDHGELMGDHNMFGKSQFYHPSVGVPGVVRPPKNMKVEKRISSPAEVIDMSATFIDIAGAAPLDASGRSLIPVMQGKQTPRYAFSEIKGRGDTLMVAVTDGRYRYTVEWNSKTPCEFFDLQEDPQELNNLINDPAGKKQAAQMQTDLIEPHMAGKVL